MTKVKITLVRSPIGSPERHKRTVKGLGLRKLQHSVIQEASLPVLGMVRQVSHLVKIEELSDEA